MASDSQLKLFNGSVNSVLKAYSQASDKRIAREHCLARVQELVGGSIPSPCCSSSHSLEVLLNTLAFVTTSLAVRSEPHVFQLCWLRSLCSLPRAPPAAYNIADVERGVNDCRRFMSSEDDWLRAYACCMCTVLAKLLDPRGAQLGKQATVIAGNLAATLRRCLEANATVIRFVASPMACLAAGVALLEHVCPLLVGEAQSSLSGQVVKELLDLITQDTEALEMHGAHFDEQARLLRWAAADGLVRAASHPTVWRSLPSAVLQAVLKYCLASLRAYNATFAPGSAAQTSRPDSSRADIDAPTLELALRLLECEHVFDTVMSLPNYLSPLLSQLLLLLPPFDERPDGAVDVDLDVRCAALRVLLGSFVRARDCQPLMMEGRTVVVDWEGLSECSCGSINQVRQLHAVIAAACDHYAAYNRLARFRPVDFPGWTREGTPAAPPPPADR